MDKNNGERPGGRISVPLVIITQIVAAALTITGSLAVMRSELDTAKEQLVRNQEIQLEILQRMSRVEATLDSVRVSLERQMTMDEQRHMGRNR